jgi:hypothetical protein
MKNREDHNSVLREALPQGSGGLFIRAEGV